MDFQPVQEIFTHVISGQTLKKMVFSRPRDRAILRLEVHLFAQNGEPMVQLTRYPADNKALHQNLPPEEAPALLCGELEQNFRQCNILTTGGDCEVKVGKKSLLIHNNIREAGPAPLQEHNRDKTRFLPDNKPIPFLQELGIMDREGRVIPRMRDKFKQINRFLELIDDVAGSLPTGRPLEIVDLCCGKSYLTFAVHHYFSVIKHREVHVTGVDLKADVIARCNAVAENLGLHGLTFLQGDILQYNPDFPVDMVISLHACNTATDIALAGAVRWGCKIILSSPCCHHELAEQLECPDLSFLTGYPILRQRLCELSTDALRSRLLEALGYEVQIVEFIDPENTPKNLMIRAVKGKKPLPQEERSRRLAEYDAVCRWLHVSPTLRKLIQVEE